MLPFVPFLVISTLVLLRLCLASSPKAILHGPNIEGRSAYVELHHVVVGAHKHPLLEPKVHMPVIAGQQRLQEEQSPGEAAKRALLALRQGYTCASGYRCQSSSLHTLLPSSI